MTELNLSVNKLQDEGVMAVAEAVKQTKVLKSLNLAGADNHGLRGISLVGGIGMTIKGTKALAEALCVNASVTECKLRGNKLGVEGWTTIFNTLRDSTVSKITTWDLYNQELGPGIAKPLADYLAFTASVTSVSLLYNNLHAETATMLLKVKEEHPALKTLCGFTHNEINLDLKGQYGKQLGQADAMLIAPELGVMASMTEVLAFSKHVYSQTDKL